MKAINPRNLRAESKVTLKDQELEKFSRIKAE